MAAAGPSEQAPILVGIDFSTGCEAALEWAVDAAIAFDTTLLTLHVVHDPAESPGYYLQAHHGEVEQIERVAQELMHDFIEEARKRVPRFDSVRRVDTAVVVGLPVTRILEVGEQENALMIVMGATGRTALADALLGSKVERVTRLAAIPVVVVKVRPEPSVTSSQE